MMEQIFENTWMFEDDGVRIFLLAGKEKALLIDTGMSGLDLHSMISGHTDLPCSLLITHADIDHISSIAQFQEFYMHPSEAFFYRNMQKGKGRILPVFNGDQFDLGGRILEIIHLPGHTPGSISVLDKENRCLIGGDPIQENGEIFMFGPHRNFDAYIAGLERLMLRGDFDYVYSSHSTLKVSRDVIPELIRGAKRIVEGNVSGEEREMFGRKVICCDIGVSRFLCEPQKS